MLAAEVVAGLAAAVAAFVIDPVSGSDDILLIVLFLALAILSDAFTIVTGRGFDVSGSLLATVLAIALTGPVGGVLVGTVSALVDGVRNRRPVPSTIANVAAYSVFPFAGGVTLKWLSDVLDASLGSLAFAVAIIAAFLVALLVNFFFVALHVRVFVGRPIREQITHVLVPLVPSELLTGLLGATVATLYPKLGVAVVVLVALVLLGFQYVLRELQRSQARAERLRALQVDVLFSMVRSLSLRDQMTARHSAAVARYAQAIARAAGASAAEQRLVHTAGLLHDNGHGDICPGKS